MGYKAGADREQPILISETLDEYVSPDNPVRFIDAFVAKLDMAELGFERAVPPREGAPGYDPRDLLKLFLYGYLNKTRSSRRLERETHRNLKVVWLVRRLRPDHKPIAEFRRKHPLHGDKKVCFNAQIAVDAKHRLIVADDVTNEVNDEWQLAPMALAAKEALESETLDVSS